MLHLHSSRRRAGKRVKELAFSHPAITFLIGFAVVPVLLMMAVVLFAAVTVLPLAWAWGWL